MVCLCMATTNSPLGDPPTNWHEGRRLRAWELHQQGWTQPAIATALGVTQGAVSQWLHRATVGGVAALRHRPASGAPPLLAPAQLAGLPALLAQGAEAWGFRGAVWTSARVATVIHRQFGVHYHPGHVRRLLRQLGWSVQKPVVRAAQRDERAIARWYDRQWPALKKKPSSKAGPLPG